MLLILRVRYCIIKRLNKEGTACKVKRLGGIIMIGKKCTVRPYYQMYENTCWKAVAKTVLNYMGLDLSHPDLTEKRNDQQGSAIDLLFRVTGREDEDFGMDSNTVPDFDTFCTEIDEGRMMIGNVSTDEAHGEIAHWILISGYAVVDGRNYIQIMDPEPEINRRRPFWLCYDNILRGDSNYYYTVPRQEEFEQRYFKSVSYMPEDIHGAIQDVTEQEWRTVTVV